MLVNGQLFNVSIIRNEQPKTFARICRQLHSASRIPPCTISPQYIHMASPILRFLLSRHMLLSHWQFCALHGRCFQLVYERVIICSNDRLPLAASHFPTRS